MKYGIIDISFAASVDKKLQQKMARSLRYSNPDNYNEDGTIKKGEKKWVHSKNYEKLAYKLHEKRRRDSEFRRYATQEMVNDLREHGDVLVTEENRVEAWKRRSKKPTEQTNKEIEVTNKKGEKKKVKNVKRKDVEWLILFYIAFQDFSWLNAKRSLRK